MLSRKTHFVGVLALLLMAGFISTSVISYFVAHDSLANQIEETALPLTSDNIYSEIQRDLLNPIFISSLMAQDTFLRDWTIEGETNAESIVRYLAEIQKRYEAVTCFFVSEKTGNYYHPSGIVKVVSPEDPHDSWYFQFKDHKNLYDVNVDSDTADPSILTVFINYRVLDYSGNLLGVTGIGLSVDSVKEMISIYQSRYGRQVYFINRKGDVTLKSEDLSIGSNIRNESGISEVTTQILSSTAFSGKYKLDGKTVFINSRLVPEFDWYLLVEQFDDPSERKIQNTLYINLAVSILISIIIIVLVNLAFGRYQKKLEEMATIDVLTGITNRQFFDTMFDQLVKISRRRKEPLSAIMFDVDNFKSINDNFGHLAGDMVLRFLADTVQSQIRDTDTFCRWGGDEFMLLLQECNQEQALDIAEKIRKRVENSSVEYKNESISITSSFGVTQLVSDDSKSTLVKRIDDALYKAKRNGKNCIELIV